jgi:rhomboid family GlyGly-CTERM serine protease
VRAIFPSPSERLAIAGAAAMLLLQATPAWHAALEYRYGSMAAEPWRAASAHLVHLNWTHAGINAAAWVVVARLFAPELRAAFQLGVIALAGALIAVWLALMHPAIDGYRGFSGVLHALYFAGATAWLAETLNDRRTRSAADLWLPAALWIGGIVKVGLEQPAGSATPYAEWLQGHVAPQAHLAGAAVGVALGSLRQLLQRRADRQPA